MLHRLRAFLGGGEAMVGWYYEKTPDGYVAL